jgi:hypothetical protein
MDDAVLALERDGVVAAGGASARTAGPVLRSAATGGEELSEAA